jgi:hypothetical protein
MIGAPDYKKEKRNSILSKNTRIFNFSNFNKEKSMKDKNLNSYLAGL